MEDARHFKDSTIEKLNDETGLKTKIMEDARNFEDSTGEKDDEETKQLQQLCPLVGDFTKKIHDTVRVMSTSDLNLEPLRAATKETSKKFDSLVALVLQSSRNKRDETTFDELQAKCEKAEIQHINDQAEIKLLESQILIHSDYCSNVGAVLGSLVWRASCKPEIVDTWLTERRDLKKLEELMTIIDRAVECFFKTYQDVLPPINRDEYLFPMGLLGTVSNISARPEGRQFLIENINGKSLIKNLVTYLPLIPADSNGKLEKLILIILWNMGVNEEGRRYLFEVDIGKVVLYCLADPKAEKLKAAGLNLLRSIAHNLTEPRLLEDLLKCVPMANIRNLAEGGLDDRVVESARDILDYMTKLEKSILRSENNN